MKSEQIVQTFPKEGKSEFSSFIEKEKNVFCFFPELKWILSFKKPTIYLHSKIVTCDQMVKEWLTSLQNPEIWHFFVKNILFMSSAINSTSHVVSNNPYGVGLPLFSGVILFLLLRQDLPNSITVNIDHFKLLVEKMGLYTQIIYGLISFICFIRNWRQWYVVFQGFGIIDRYLVVNVLLLKENWM